MASSTSQKILVSGFTSIILCLAEFWMLLYGALLDYSDIVRNEDVVGIELSIKVLGVIVAIAFLLVVGFSRKKSRALSVVLGVLWVVYVIELVLAMIGFSFDNEVDVFARALFLAVPLCGNVLGSAAAIAMSNRQDRNK